MKKKVKKKIVYYEDTGETISSVGHIGRVGMQPTDQEIVKLMIQ